LEGLLNIGPETEVLEIGCAEAGNLKPFLDLGCNVTGIDISCGRIELAREFFAEHPKKEILELICEDIYKADLKGKSLISF
jgi:SAM-dependent methyltransferase